MNYKLTIKGKQFSRLIEANSLEDALEVALIFGYKKSNIKIAPVSGELGIWAYLEDTLRRPRYVKKWFSSGINYRPQSAFAVASSLF